MLAEAIYAGILLTSYGYHRWQQHQANKDKPKAYGEVDSPFVEITLPRVDEGAPKPLIYGRCKVTAPILAWTGTPYFGGETYQIPVFFVLGIPFLNGNNRLLQIWVSDLALSDVSTNVWGIDQPSPQPLGDLTGKGTASAVLSTAGYEQPAVASNLAAISFTDGGIFVGGSVEFLDGSDSQLMVSGGVPLTMAATRMTGDFTDPHGDSNTGFVDVADIPDYRRRLCVFLGGQIVGELAPTITGPNRRGWSFGASNAVSPIRFEVASYPAGDGLAGTRTVGQEANPADVIYDLLTSPLKLGLPLVSIDMTSFHAAAFTLLDEGNGYSRAIQDSKPAEEHIFEILQQIDAVLYVDPQTLKWTLKLIRADYDPDTAPHFTPSNCKLERITLSGHTGIVNKIRIPFSNRQEHYREGNGEASNDANAVGQSGEVNELVLPMLGICTQELADTVAERELSARSKPVVIAQISTGQQNAYLTPGMAVAFTWPELGLSKLFLRIAKIDPGKVGNSDVTIDLIQDFAQIHRGDFDEIEVPGVPAHRG